MAARIFLCTALCLATAVAADDSTLPGTAPLQMPDTVVEDHLAQIDTYFQQRIAAARNARDQQWQEAATSDRDLARLLQARRASLRKMLGLESSRKQSPTVQVDVITAQENLRVERLTIPVAEGLAARGLLFTMPARGVRPAIIACCDADAWPEQFVGLQESRRLAPWLQTLLARGAIVYVPQSIERLNDHPYCQQIKVAVGQPDSPGKDRRWILYRLGYVVGHTMPGLDVQDVLAAIDYLVSRPEVDAQRIGIAGMGQGGMTAMYAAALDSRFATASVADYFANRDTCWQEAVDRRLPAQLVSSGDAEVVSLIAPRPLAIVRSGRSPIPDDSERSEFDRANDTTNDSRPAAPSLPPVCRRSVIRWSA